MVEREAVYKAFDCRPPIEVTVKNHRDPSPNYLAPLLNCNNIRFEKKRLRASIPLPRLQNWVNRDNLRADFLSKRMSEGGLPRPKRPTNYDEERQEILPCACVPP